MTKRRKEPSEGRKVRLEDNARKRAEAAKEAEDKIDEMVKHSIEKHGL